VLLHGKRRLPVEHRHRADRILEILAGKPSNATMALIRDMVNRAAAISVPVVPKLAI